MSIMKPLIICLLLVFSLQASPTDSLLIEIKEELRIARLEQRKAQGAYRLAALSWGGATTIVTVGSAVGLPVLFIPAAALGAAGWFAIAFQGDIRVIDGIR